LNLTIVLRQYIVEDEQERGGNKNKQKSTTTALAKKRQKIAKALTSNCKRYGNCKRIPKVKRGSPSRKMDRKGALGIIKQKDSQRQRLQQNYSRQWNEIFERLKVYQREHGEDNAVYQIVSSKA
jgi:hypothetical protein